MEIRIQRKGYVLSISFGRKTQWFEQLSFFTVIKEYYGDDRKVSFAELIYPFYIHPK